MKYLLIAVLLILAGCTFAITDTPQLRDAIDAKSALDVLPVPDKPRSLPGRLRIVVLVTLTPNLVPTVTSTPEANP